MSSDIKLVDSHAHLEEMEDLDRVIARARECGVVVIIAVGSDYESNNRTLEIAEKYQPWVYPALGAHPWDTEAAVASLDRNLQFIEDHLGEIVAIGEVGLDYHKAVLKRGSKERQKYLLGSLLELARKAGKPALIHSRYAWRDSLTMVREAKVEKAVFHWYTGPVNVLGDILSQGYFISATLAAEYHEEHRRAIKETPLERLLLETDSPVVYRQGMEVAYKAEPADMVRSLHAVAQLKALEPGIVAEKTTKNALGFYQINLPTR